MSIFLLSPLFSYVLIISPQHYEVDFALVHNPKEAYTSSSKSDFLSFHSKKGLSYTVILFKKWRFIEKEESTGK
jgi:hypothetical protein